MGFPDIRMRRLRYDPRIRKMVMETEVTRNNLIYPVFVAHGEKVKKEITSMPGVFNYSVDTLIEEAKEVASLGIPALMLFGIPAVKDPLGSEAYSPNGIVQQACFALKKRVPEILIFTDVCLCEYTSHGHCGLLEEGCIDNDRTLEVLAKSALSFAEAGADVVAPSDMMDGRVKAIRALLDESAFTHIPILSYSTKFASGFYGPFRDAAQSTPAFGDRRSHQLDPANGRQALRESLLDEEEGADMLMVKPALAYLDVIRELRDSTLLPIAAYNVSGGFSMVKAAAKLGWIDEERVMMEIITAIKRAGADISF